MDVEWEARLPERLRTTLLYATGLPALALALTGMVGPLVLDVAWLPNLILVAGLWLFVAPVLKRRRTYRATPEGITRERRLHTSFHPWEAFDGYERTATGLVVRRSSPLGPSIRCDTDDIEDVEAVVEALDAYLDRL